MQNPADGLRRDFTHSILLEPQRIPALSAKQKAASEETA